jgi:glycosyltransferase involved in cell wall biosynthesis
LVKSIECPEMAERSIGSGYSPTCSVVVCTRNRPTQLDQCLASLAALDYPAYDVVVVDNAPSDLRSREVALRWGVRYLTEQIPGLSRARNCGARASSSEIVAYLDDDALAEPDWLSVLVRDFEDPRAMAVTGAILPTHLDNSEGQPREAPAPSAAGRSERRVVDRETPGWFELANFGGVGDGSNMAFRRSVFDTWQGFEENLGRGTILNGGEEHCAFYTLIERGYRVVYNPAAVIRHPDPPTADEVRKRHLHLLAIAAAYITRLAVEHPSSRRPLARYIFDRLRGTTRPWTDRPSKASPALAPRWLTLLTMLSGPWIYLRSRLAAKPRARQSEVPGQNLHPSPIPRTALRD